MNVIVGFVILLLFGFTASRLTLFKDKLSLGTQYVFLAGTEFLLIGLVTGPRLFQIITETTLHQLSPVLGLGLGWIGLLIGLQFDHRIVARIPLVTWGIGGILSVTAFSFCFGAMRLLTPWILTHIGGAVFDNSLPWNKFVRVLTGFSFLLGCIAVVSTYSALALLKRDAQARSETTRLLQLLTDLCSPMAITAMGLWYALCHSSILTYPAAQTGLDRYLPRLITESATPWIPDSALPILSGPSWVIFTLLLGIILGWMVHYLTSHRLAENEILLILTGSVILSGGLSTYIHLSPLFVNLVMGITLANLPNFTLGRLSKWMHATEKPFYVIFMILVGAMWPPVTPMVLALTGVYLVSRIMGLWLGGRLAARWLIPQEPSIPTHFGLAMIPQGGVALAMTVDFALITPGAMAETALGVMILAVLLQQLFGPSLMASILRTPGIREKGTNA